MDLGDFAKYLKGGQGALAVLKSNNVTVGQAIGIAKGLEPVLAEVGITLPPAIHDALAVLGTLAGETPQG